MAQYRQGHQAGDYGGVQVYKPDSAGAPGRRPKPLVTRDRNNDCLGQQQQLQQQHPTRSHEADDSTCHSTRHEQGVTWQPEVTAQTKMRARLWTLSAETRLLSLLAKHGMYTASSRQCSTLCSQHSTHPSLQLYASNQSRSVCRSGSCHRSPQNVKKDTAASSHISASQKHMVAPSSIAICAHT